VLYDAPMIMDNKTLTNPWDHIKGIEPISLCDWPGKVVCVLFFGGCNFKCPTCHNFLLAQHPEKIPSVDKEEILFFLKARRAWLDGVVLSGGEPTYIRGLKKVIMALREMGFKIKLDTNASHPEVVEELLTQGLVDLVAVDVKGPYDLYPQLTGDAISREEIREKLTAIFSIAKDHPSMFYFRCTQVPLLTDTHLEEVRSYLPRGFELYIQKYIKPRHIHNEDNKEG